MELLILVAVLVVAILVQVGVKAAQVLLSLGTYYD
jgi:hypothetical protein